MGNLKVDSICEAEQPLVGEQEDILLRRLKKEDLGPCMHCKWDLLEPKDYVLSIEITDGYVYLCPECENELLSRLLTNYLRRLRRKKAGTVSALAKYEDAADDDDLESE